MICTSFRPAFENATCNEASKFARMLLMPEDKFRDGVEIEKNIGKIANIFGVPPVIVQIRAKELGYKLKDND